MPELSFFPCGFSLLSFDASFIERTINAPGRVPSFVFHHYFNAQMTTSSLALAGGTKSALLSFPTIFVESTYSPSL